MSGYDDSDVQEFLKRLERAQSIIDSEFMQAAKDIGLAFLKEVKERTPKGLTGKLNQSWKIEVTKKRKRVRGYRIQPYGVCFFRRKWTPPTSRALCPCNW